jgi:hypothetical protein
MIGRGTPRSQSKMPRPIAGSSISGVRLLGNASRPGKFLRCRLTLPLKSTQHARLTDIKLEWGSPRGQADQAAGKSSHVAPRNVRRFDTLFANESHANLVTRAKKSTRQMAASEID